jgi:hypothetical protein
MVMPRKFSESAQASTDNPDTLCTMSALSVPTHRRSQIFTGDGTASEQPKSRTDSADNTNILSSKSLLDTPAEANAPDKKVSECLWVNPDNADALEQSPTVENVAATPATVANVAKVEQAEDKTLATLATVALAKPRDPKTGELVPNMLAMAEPLPSAEFQARLGSFRSRTNPQAIHLVDILMSRL